MEERKLIICRGIQGSGKSTWAKQWVHKDPEHRIRFNNDDIRNMLGDYWVPSREKIIKRIFQNYMIVAMNNGYNIVVDNMNLNPTTCKELEKFVVDFNKESEDFSWKYEVEYKDFFIPVEECIRRDAVRPNPIGEKVIKDTWKRYRDFIIKEDLLTSINNKLKQPIDKPIAVIVDLDGTISFNVTGRPFFGEGAAEGMLTDLPNNDVINIIQGYCDAVDSELIIVTGREDTPEIRSATEDWLSDNHIYVTEVLMRPVGDYSPAPQCKKVIFHDYIKDNYNVVAVFEDSQNCVDMWRELGLTCLQPNYGKF